MDRRRYETFTPHSFAEMTQAPSNSATIVVYLVGCMAAGIWLRRHLVKHVADECASQGICLQTKLNWSALDLTRWTSA